MAPFREHLRTPISFVATVTRKNGQIMTGQVTSASLGGAFINCDHSVLRVGETCEISIVLSDGQSSIDGIAEISYTSAEGIGVRFDGLDPSSFEHLIRLMMFHVHQPEVIRAESRRMKKNIS